MGSTSPKVLPGKNYTKRLLESTLGSEGELSLSGPGGDVRPGSDTHLSSPVSISVPSRPTQVALDPRDLPVSSLQHPPQSAYDKRILFRGARCPTQLARERSLRPSTITHGEQLSPAKNEYCRLIFAVQ